MDVTKLKAIWAKIKETIGKLNKKVKALIIAGILLLLVGSAGLAIYFNTRPYVVLFENLNETEAAEIVTLLGEAGAEYKYKADGTVLVKEQQEDQLRAQLVMAGYPKSGTSYDIYLNNVSMMTTDADRRNYELYDLENKIAATIRMFTGVKDAVVNITPAEEQKYVIGNEPSMDASAYVAVTMIDGESPSEAQVKGIQRLISTSVSKIKFENIAIVDGNGNDVTVSENSEDGDRSLASQLKLDVEKEIEASIRNNVLNVLKPIYGEDNVKVSVKATVDIDKRIREIINYSAPPNEEDKIGIPGNVSIDQELSRPEGTQGGIPGTETNAEVPIYGQQMQTDGTEDYWKNQQDINYLVDQITEQVQMDTGSLEDLNVSVVVNGQDFGDLTRASLRDIIARAAGISNADKNDKIAVESAPFYLATTEPEVTDSFNRWVLIGGLAAAALVLLLALLILVLRKRKKKAQEAAALAEVQLTETMVVPPLSEELEGEAVEGQEEAVDTADSSKELLRIQNEKSMELKENIRKFAEENSEISAQLIKSWLRGGEDNG